MPSPRRSPGRASTRARRARTRKSAPRRPGPARRALRAKGRKPARVAARKRAAAPAASGARAASPAPPAGRSVDFINWLRQQGAKFSVRQHAEVFTAQEVAAAVRVTGYELAKVVVLKADQRFALAVVPAPLRVDLKAASGVLKARRVSLAREEEFESLFPGCDRGAMPPFGELWGMPTYVDESLAAHEQIVFNAGSHIETVTMPYREYERLARPQRARIATADR
jgi:Ala-tRNA(Pro) deacylase